MLGVRITLIAWFHVAIDKGGEIYRYMMTMLPLATVIWKLLGNLLVFSELCVEVSTSNSSAFMRCPKACICTADLLSCARQELRQVPVTLPPTATTLDLSHNAITHLNDHCLAPLPCLQTLRISHNQINNLSQQVFHNSTSLVHLDMSSNHLHAVKKHYFENLVNLEELLLYNNKIVEVDENAFAKLINLQKVYLSLNHITKFPFRSIQGFKHTHLRILDLSANNLSSIPVRELAALPVYIKNGLYLHNNPVKCECSLHQMLQEWKHRGFRSVQDFKDQHTCKVYSNTPRSIINTFKYKYFENCSRGLKQFGIPEVIYKVGESLVIPCNTSLCDDNTTIYRWISPKHELFVYRELRDETHEVLENGSLKITNAKFLHSGVYVCIAISERQKINATHEVNVTIRYPKLDDPFPTSITTLLGCVVSLLLVLMYLYLTPCHCSTCFRKPTTPPQDYSAQSSILSTTPPATEGPNRKISTNKHVVFLEPAEESQNGKVRLAVSEDFSDVKSRRSLQLQMDSEATRSVFSDRPIMTYEAEELSEADA